MEIKFITVSVLLCVLIGESVQQSDNEDLIITHDQKLKLDKFRELVSSTLPHEYMKKDIYLIRWLRFQKFNIEAAEQMLLENLQWREENRMDTILQEDWSDLDQEYKVEIEGCDKEGRPVASVHLGDWDIRKAAVTGKIQRLRRYIGRVFEEAASLIRAMEDRGENITRSTMVMEMSNYNLIAHGCPQCIPLYIYLFQTYFQHYPKTLNKIRLINTPIAFEALWQVLAPFIPEESRRNVVIYGRDKKQWQTALLKDIDSGQLTPGFGGTRSNILDVGELRARGEKEFRCDQ